MTDILNFLYTLDQDYFGAFWEYVDWLRMVDHGFVLSSTTGTVKDYKEHKDAEFKVNGKTYSCDVKGPRKSLFTGEFADDIAFELEARNGRIGSGMGNQDFTHYYVVDIQGHFHVLEVRQKELQSWFLKKEVSEQGNQYYYKRRRSGQSWIMFAPFVDVIAQRTGVGYYRENVDKYVIQVYNEVLKNGLSCLDRFVAKKDRK